MSFNQIRWLRIWKMQLLDEDHLLIKYASEDVVTLRLDEAFLCHNTNGGHLPFLPTLIVYPSLGSFLYFLIKAVG